MPRYEVFKLTRLSRFIGHFEADTEDEAIEKAIKGKIYQSLGGPCWQCTDNLGDEDDEEFTAFVDELRPGEGEAK